MRQAAPRVATEATASTAELEAFFEAVILLLLMQKTRRLFVSKWLHLEMMAIERQGAVVDCDLVWQFVVLVCCVWSGTQVLPT